MTEQAPVDPEVRPPVPPFTLETAARKVRLAEDAWNSRDPDRVVQVYTHDTQWRNRAEFPVGREQVREFLRRKWARELDYRLIKELWTFGGERIAVRFAYEWHDDSGHWYRSYGNENWEFTEQGLMRRRFASINAEIVARHTKQQDWSETVVQGDFFTARYVSMGSGKSTKPMLYADDRVVWVVQSGQIRFTIAGQEPFVASQGFLVEVPYRTVYQLQTVGDTPSLRFEVIATGTTPVFPIDVTPEPAPGKQYVKVSTYGQGHYDATNKPYLDFDKVIVQGGARAGAFVSDDKTFVNVIRSHGTPPPPSTDLGHFHLDFDEFWFILEGQIDYQIEGVPFFSAAPGDVVYVPKGRWHRASSGGQAMSTRVAINPRPDGMHNFQPPE